MKWTKVKDRLPEMSDLEVLGYSKKWIHPDFNPKGIRVCFVYGDSTQWISANWWDSQDTYLTDEETEPTHWQLIPESPTS